jgi:hypothetical protein
MEPEERREQELAMGLRRFPGVATRSSQVRRGLDLYRLGKGDPEARPCQLT